MSERRMWPTPRAQEPAQTSVGYGRGLAELVEGKQQIGAVRIASTQLTLFAEAFPVSRTPLLADVAALRMTATSGLSTPDSFASYDPDGSWRKTCRGFSQVTLDGSLERFSETWPRAGMTRNGIAYQLPPSAPITSGTESGLWRTPQAGEGNGGGQDSRRRQQGGHCVYLRDQVKTWPTPQAQMAKHGAATPREIAQELAHRRRINLHVEVALRAWPTPTARDYRSPGTAERLVLARHESSRWQPLTEEVGGSLNPTWVEWLMGYPAEWTALKDWATASSRRSRNGSPGASSKPKHSKRSAR